MGNEEKEEVTFAPKSFFQQWDCYNQSPAYQCPNESTLEAVCGTARIRCCKDKRCKERAKEAALVLNGWGTQT